MVCPQVEIWNHLWKLLKEVDIIISEIKTKIYNILTSNLAYTVIDNPYDEEEDKTFPYLMLTLNNVVRDRTKTSFMNKIKFKIDIFSNYDGEFEILDIEEKIFNHIAQLYDLEYVTYIQESSFRILDDKSLGPNYKHGIIIYTVYTTGMEQEADEDEENDSTD